MHIRSLTFLVVLTVISCVPSATPEESAERLADAQCSCLEPVVKRVRAQHPELLRTDTTGEGSPLPISFKERDALVELIHADPEGAACFTNTERNNPSDEYITDRELYARYMSALEPAMNTCWDHLGLPFDFHTEPSAPAPSEH